MEGIRNIKIPREIYDKYVPLYDSGEIKVEELFFLLGFYVLSDGSIYYKKNYQMELHTEYIENSLRFNPILNGRHFIFSIHRVIAFYLFGVKLFTKGLEVIHKDNDMKNNSFENLKLGTHSERMMLTPEKQRKKLGAFAASAKQKYDPETVIKFYDNCGGSYKKTQEEFGMSKSTLSNILKKRGMDTSNREMKLEILKGYIDTLENVGDRAGRMIFFFIKLHNMLILETMFKEEIDMNELHIAKHLTVKKSVKINEICKIFSDLHNEKNLAVDNMEKVIEIESIKKHIDNNPEFYIKVLELTT